MDQPPTTRSSIAAIINKRPGTVLCGIVVLALILRLSALMLTEGYSYYSLVDQVRDLGMARLAMNGDVDALYLGTPPYDASFKTPSFLNNSIHGLLYTLVPTIYTPALFVVLLNSLALVLVYFIIEFLFPGKHTYSLLTCFMLAVFPYPVNYSVGMWNPHYIFPFTMLTLFGATLWLIKGRKGGIVVASVGNVLLLQYHLIGLFLLPAFAVLYGVFRPGVSRRHLVYALLPWLIFYGGYFAVDATRDFGNTRTAILDTGRHFEPEVLKIASNPVFVSSAEISRFLSWRNFSVGQGDDARPQAVKLLGEGMANYIGFHDKALGTFVLALLVNAVNLFWVVVAFIWAIKRGHAAIRAAWRKRTIKGNEAYIFIAIWLVVPILAFLVTTKPHSLRYAQIMFPFTFLVQVILYLKIGRTTFLARCYRCFFPFLLIYGFYISCAYVGYIRWQVTNAPYLLPTYTNCERISQVIYEDAARLGKRPVIDVRAPASAAIHTNGVAMAARYLNRVRLAGEPMPDQTATYHVPSADDLESRTGMTLIGQVRQFKVYRLPGQAGADAPGNRNRSAGP